MPKYSLEQLLMSLLLAKTSSGIKGGISGEEFYLYLKTLSDNSHMPDLLDNYLDLGKNNSRKSYEVLCRKLTSQTVNNINKEPEVIFSKNILYPTYKLNYYAERYKIENNCGELYFALLERLAFLTIKELPNITNIKSKISTMSKVPNDIMKKAKRISACFVIYLQETIFNRVANATKQGIFFIGQFSININDIKNLYNILVENIAKMLSEEPDLQLSNNMNHCRAYTNYCHIMGNVEPKIKELFNGAEVGYNVYDSNHFYVMPYDNRYEEDKMGSISYLISSLNVNASYLDRTIEEYDKIIEKKADKREEVIMKTR